MEAADFMLWVERIYALKKILICGKVAQKDLTDNSPHSFVVGFAIAEYLPFDEYNLHNMFSNIKLFRE